MTGKCRDNFTVLGAIVTYNPDKARLQENINAVLPQIDHLFIVDNGSDNSNVIKIGGVLRM